jgi:AcrR family transcriptional regulator
MSSDETGSTRDLILDRSMQLFNEYGIESVSINRVAESLSISPGNFTYHFRRKADLAAALIDRLETQMITGLRDFPYTSGAWSFVQAYAELFGVTWRHRGLFNSAAYLIQANLVSAARFKTVNTQITTLMVQQTERLVAQGFLQKIPPPYDARTLIDCIWWQWLGWLRTNQLLEPKDHVQVSDIIKSGIHHCIFLTRPYMRKDYPAKLYQAVQELEVDEKTPA